MKKTFLSMTKVIVLITWFVHVSFIFYDNLYPDVPSMKVYSKSMKNMDFPICFKICFYEKGKERFKRLGYSYDQRFFKGENLFNKSIVGWLGHTRNGSRFNHFEGKFVYFET